MIKHYILCVFLSCFGLFTFCLANIDETRDQKLISTFQVVRFPNDVCVGSNSQNGTCYTSQECSDKGGASAGTCADGFGVCCTFVIDTCGSTSSENVTVWKQPTTVNPGTCSLNVCPTEDICSLRLDFTNFVISGPSTISFAQVRRQLGNVVQDQTDANLVLMGSTYTTNCLTDTFYATSPSPSSTPPVVCGTNSGQHMYVEADHDRCNMLKFHLADMATTYTTGNQITTTRGVSSLATRSWTITISHIECSSPVVPPAGCTKYWWGSGRATLMNYNRVGLSNTAAVVTRTILGMQHERMCIRRERGNCIGCFHAANAADFSLTYLGGGNAEQFTTPTGCCGYQTAEPINAANTEADIEHAGVHDIAANLSMFGFDCIIIPGAFMPTNNAAGAVINPQTAAILQQAMTASPTLAQGPTPSGPQICGQGSGIGAGVANLFELPVDDANGALSGGGAGANLSVCTRNVPFLLEFMSDDLEGVGRGSVVATDLDSEYQSATQQWNQGFVLDHTQLAC